MAQVVFGQKSTGEALGLDDSERTQASFQMVRDWATKQGILRVTFWLEDAEDKRMNPQFDDGPTLVTWIDTRIFLNGQEDVLKSQLDFALAEHRRRARR